VGEESRANNSPIEIPIRKNLFTVGPDGSPKLICSRCRECGNTFYPKEKMCPSCVKEGTLERVEIRGRGRIVSFTQVMRGLPGYDSPYILACIELDGGPSLIAQLEGWQGVAVKTHMPVELVIGRIKQEKNGTVVIGPKFKPVAK
jgi:uncharacterized OB-fold protein